MKASCRAARPLAAGGWAWDFGIHLSLPPFCRAWSPDHAKTLPYRTLQNCDDFSMICRGRRPRRPGRIYIFIGESQAIMPHSGNISGKARHLGRCKHRPLQTIFRFAAKISRFFAGESYSPPLQRFFDFHHTKTRTASGSSSAVRVLLTPNSSSPSSFPSYAGRPARSGRTACGGRSSA